MKCEIEGTPICSQVNPDVKEYDFIILDPTSVDISRGSFCYLA